MKKFLIAFCAVMLFVSSSEAKTIDVLLKNDTKSCKIAGTSYVLTVASGKKTPAVTGTFSLSYDGGSKLKSGKTTYVMPVTVTSPNPISIDGASYRGKIIFEATKTGFHVVNRVDVEDYLKGVIRDEMSPSWHAEALKAQAVLARTYALSSAKHGKYNVCDKVHCQSYSGTSAESAAVVKAVEATSGETLTYGGALAQVFYYADSGGYGASSKSVWGKEIKYLAARPDPVAIKGRDSTWQTSFTMAKITERLKAAKLVSGTVTSITPVERDESGRVKKLEIKAGGTSRTISGSQFRAALGSTAVKSTLFEFDERTAYKTPRVTVKKTASSGVAKKTKKAAKAKANAEEKASEKSPSAIDTSTMPDDDLEKLYWMSRHGVYSVGELVSMVGKDGEYPKFVAQGYERMEKMSTTPQTESEKAAPVETEEETEEETKGTAVTAVEIPPAQKLSNRSAKGSSVTIYGRGSGHGVGLPQWTAKALAEAGWKYKEILDYYFPGTKTAKIK